jgi:hypothetical protein
MVKKMTFKTTTQKLTRTLAVSLAVTGAVISQGLLDFESGLGNHYIPGGINTNYGIIPAAARTGNFGFFGGDIMADEFRPVSIYQNNTSDFSNGVFSISSWFKNRSLTNPDYNESWLSLTPGNPFLSDPAGGSVGTSTVEREGLIMGAANNQIYFQDHRDSMTSSLVTALPIGGAVTPGQWYFMEAIIDTTGSNLTVDLFIDTAWIATHNYGSLSNFGWLTNARGGMMVDDYADDANFEAVPEPGTMVALGLAGLVIARRRNSH